MNIGYKRNMSIWAIIIKDILTNGLSFSGTRMGIGSYPNRTYTYGSLNQDPITLFNRTRTEPNPLISVPFGSVPFGSIYVPRTSQNSLTCCGP